MKNYKQEWNFLFLILRSILTDTLKRSKAPFDKIVRDKLDSVLEICGCGII